MEGNKWYVAYEGKPVPNAEGEQELEKRAALFCTSVSLLTFSRNQKPRDNTVHPCHCMNTVGVVFN